MYYIVIYITLTKEVMHIIDCYIRHNSFAESLMASYLEIRITEGNLIAIMIYR